MDMERCKQRVADEQMVPLLPRTPPVEKGSIQALEAFPLLQSPAQCAHERRVGAGLAALLLPRPHSRSHDKGQNLLSVEATSVIALPVRFFLFGNPCCLAITAWPNTAGSVSG